MPTATHPKLSFIADELQALKDQHLYQSLVTVQSAQGPEITLDGRPNILNFSANNYLGLCNHPTLKEAAKKAIDQWGVGAGAVRTIIGTLELHQQLENTLAEFKHCEATMVFQSGFTANAGAVNSIMGDDDYILSDALNHASIIDAVRLNKAKKGVYEHSNMADLEEKLKAAQGFRRRLVVTDGVFSMDGDVAKLPEIADLCDQYNALLMVDDAHGSGVFGNHGEGTVAHFDLCNRVDIVVGTLSKALGSMGGYVASTQAMRDLMVNKARPLLFSTPHPPAVTASALAAVQLMMADNSLVQKLWHNTRYFKGEMERLGYTITSDSPILPVIVGSSERAQLLSKRLLEEGVFARAIVFPTVAKDKARVRLMMSAAFTTQQLDRGLEAFKKLGKELSLVES
ncbi:MAG: glycine C-acetyltransferase [Vampirovibrionales bacterium]